MRAKPLLSFVFTFTLFACGGTGAPSSSDTSSALSDTETAPATIELVQAGFFHDESATSTPRRVPRLAHIGFVDSRGGAWEGVRDVEFRYAGGKNEAVVVDVPQDLRNKKLLAYSIQYDRYSANTRSPGPKGWFAESVVPLDTSKGKWMTADVSSGAGYPFAGECYSMSVRGEHFDGKLRGVVYGFTSASKSDYDANNDVPWLDAEGSPKDEGFLAADIQHDGGYKGSYNSLPLWMRVPEGKNLVFKASLDRFSGTCLSHDDTKLLPPPAGRDSHLTKTYYQQP